MAWLQRLLGRDRPRDALMPLYRAVIDHARDPQWYRSGAVPDTVDGRFDMVAAILSLVLVRLEAEGESLASESALLAELFIEDMDAQLREEGMGDVVVGKHVGKMMGALAGRMSAYRDGFGGSGDLETALVRNLYRGERPTEAALDFTRGRLIALFDALSESDASAVICGQLPPL